MNCFRPSEEVNINLTLDETSGRVDLGRHFVTQEAETSVDDVVQNYVQFGQPFVTPDGFLSLIISPDLRIDFNSNHSICVTTPAMKVAIDHSGFNIGVIHPYGRVYQEIDKRCVHIESGLHLAKMCNRGVTFTSLCRSLIYLVDTSGCKTTTERFRKLNYDFTADIFHADSLTGDVARQRSFAELCRHSFEMSKDGSDMNWWLQGSTSSIVFANLLASIYGIYLDATIYCKWYNDHFIINCCPGAKIRHNLANGNVTINKAYNQIHINIHPTKNYLRVNSEILRIVANLSAETYFQVIKPHPRDEQRVAASANRFQVKNGSQKAGFDVNDELVLM